MHRKLKIYLDTSVWSFYYADDAPEKKDITKDFFDRSKEYDIFISDVVFDEINKAEPELKDKLIELIRKTQPISLDFKNEIKSLADIYIARKIIPVKKMDDALHIAFSVIYGVDILLSWNYKHLANVIRKQKISIVNTEEGYHKFLEIITPLEVLNED